MKYYDSNMSNGVHVIETIIQSFEYKGRIVSSMGGNCMGKAVIDFDFETADDNVKNDCNLQYNEDYDYWKAKLHDKDGNTLLVEEDSNDFNDMIVKNEIIGHFKSRDEADAFIKSIQMT